MSSFPYSVEEIIAFLKIYEIIIINRKDNQNKVFRESVNATYEEQIEFLRNELKKEHCVNDLVIDRDRIDNYLYVFKKMFKNRWCYIKLAIDDIH